MKFPITRETLYAIDPVKERKEKYDIALEFHIKSLVDEICYELESIILWEIPTLKTGYMVTTDYIQEMINKRGALMRNKRYIWNGLKNIRMNPSNSKEISVNESILIQRLVEKLKGTFVGCDIIIDPLKTYLIIDWS